MKKRERKGSKKGVEGEAGQEYEATEGLVREIDETNFVQNGV